MESKYKVHSFYILLILVSIIIGLVSVKWSDVPGLVDYFTFALTLSSLILAGLAIVYSIYSNTSISSSLTEITSAASSVRKASTDIGISNRELKKEIEKIPVRFDAVEENIAHTHRVVNELSAKQEITLSAPSKPATTASISKAELSDNQVLKFLNGSSIRGLEMILMLYYGYKTQTAFSIKEFIEKNDSYRGSHDYLLAYLIASNALGLLSYKLDGSSRIVVESMHQAITNNMEKVMTKKLSDTAIEMASDRENDEEEIESWLKIMTTISSYFGETG
ncbi:MAG: hypothetical protein V7780_14235 [Colwellia sp.]